MFTGNPQLTHAIDAADLPDIIEDTTGRACPPRGGTIHDPRPEFEEQHASFSVFQKGSVWFYKRRGGPEDRGTAWHFLLSMGWDHQLAAEYLITRFGDPTMDASERRDTRITAPLTELERAVQLNDLWTPLTRAEESAAWEAPQALSAHATADLNARGLLNSPVLRVNGARGGGYAFGVHGPTGALLGVKVRQGPGLSPEYILRTSGRGTPPWCSPRYGRASAVLIVEGELNAAAAAHAAHVTGLDIDVQGIPGQDTTPHLAGLDRDVLLYMDADDGHEETVTRLTSIALGCAARSVTRLPLLPAGVDFCDVLGQRGPQALADFIQLPPSATPVFPPSDLTPLSTRPYVPAEQWPMRPGGTA